VLCGRRIATAAVMVAHVARQQRHLPRATPMSRTAALGACLVAVRTAAVPSGFGRGVGENLDGDVCGRCSLLAGVFLYLLTFPCQMLQVKIFSILN